MPTKLRHGWLRSALADKGLRQKDLAKLWGCDEAVVSRFVKTGDPELTWDRANTLSSKLGMSLEELKLRLQEGIAPRTRTTAATRLVPNGAPAVASVDDVAVAMADAKAAVQRLKELLPDAQIVFQINLGE